MTENKGDLISREALKDAIMYKDNVNSETWEQLYDSVLEEIDNAPTVDINKLILIVAKRSGKREMMLNALRPQGEWEESHIFSCGNILRMGMDVIEHKCKNCGRWSIKWVRTIPDNYCPNCGADMRGGAE